MNKRQAKIEAITRVIQHIENDMAGGGLENYDGDDAPKVEHELEAIAQSLQQRLARLDRDQRPYRDILKNG